MKISAIQLDSKQAIIEGPYHYAESMIRLALKEAPDVILLPEKWNAFGPQQRHLKQADKDGEKTKTLLSQLAKEGDVNIIGGSVIELRGDKLYNTAYVFNRKGEEILRYDKCHLYMDGEKNYYTAGDKIGIVTIDGVTCGVAICYDMDFPEWVRCYALKGAEIIFASFFWPKNYMHHLEMVQQSRALENQCFVVAAGLCKSDGLGGYHSGGTAVVSPKGEIVAKLDSAPGILTTEIKKETLIEARTWQHFLEDRRADLYQYYGIDHKNK